MHLYVYTYIYIIYLCIYIYRTFFPSPKIKAMREVLSSIHSVAAGAMPSPNATDMQDEGK